MMPRLPKGVLLDYGGTLLEEAGYDLRGGIAAMLSHASYLAPGVTLDVVMARAKRVSAELANRRDTFGIETPWPSLMRLIHDYFSTRFSVSMDELEAIFWDASVVTRPMPGALAGLDALHAAGIPMAVLSNSSFGAPIILRDIAKHGLADHLSFVMVTADYAVRKPSALLFETAAARLGVAPADTWFVGDRLDTDVAGAQAAGMVAVWLRPPNAAATGAPDLTFDGWSVLQRWVEQAGDAAVAS
jgi:HAD superfamily hydrolase (TIGR01662 family)